MTDGATRRFGVAGYPVAHSRSPQMHMAAYAELGIDADYQRLPIPPELFEETVRALPASGFSGINVTIPHKEAAAMLADTSSDAVASIRAANTLTFTDSGIRADNTDAPAMLGALTELTDLGDKRALVLGAGGTGMAATWALVESGARVEIWNRTYTRAEEIAIDLNATAITDSGGGAGYDVIVNTTSVGMHESNTETDIEQHLRLDFDAISDQTIVVDFVYRADGSPLAAAANRRGLRVVPGIDLLARQAALSFELWFNQPAPLATMQAALT